MLAAVLASEACSDSDWSEEGEEGRVWSYANLVLDWASAGRTLILGFDWSECFVSTTTTESSLSDEGSLLLLCVLDCVCVCGVGLETPPNNTITVIAVSL